MPWAPQIGRGIFLDSRQPSPVPLCPADLTRLRRDLLSGEAGAGPSHSRQRKSRGPQVGQRGAPGTPLLPFFSMVHKRPSVGGKASLKRQGSPLASQLAAALDYRLVPGGHEGEEHPAVCGTTGLKQGGRRSLSLTTTILRHVHTTAKGLGKWRHGQSRAPGVAGGWVGPGVFPPSCTNTPPQPRWPSAGAGCVPRAVFTSYLQNI